MKKIRDRIKIIDYCACCRMPVVEHQGISCNVHGLTFCSRQCLGLYHQQEYVTV